jgi:primosomal protein N' (replication factor Y)
MPQFSDVALPVPLDMVFTYAIPEGMEPVVGGRVLVPFRQQRMSGIVVELHDRPPQENASHIKIKKVLEALRSEKYFAPCSRFRRNSSGP